MKITSQTLPVVVLLALSACGRSVPALTPSGEDQVFVEDVHLAIQCELIAAVHEANRQANEISSRRANAADFFKTWGIKYTLTLKVVEDSSVSTSISGASDLTPVPRETVATLGLKYGRTAKATRTEKDQSLRPVKRYSEMQACSGEQTNKIVPGGGNLGLRSWMLTRLALVDNAVIGPLSEKEAFAYTIQFDLARTGGFEPLFAFVGEKWTPVGVPVTGGRSTAHNITVTLGPLAPASTPKKTASGAKAPAREKLDNNAARVHELSLINDAIAN